MIYFSLLIIFIFIFYKLKDNSSKFLESERQKELEEQEAAKRRQIAREFVENKSSFFTSVSESKEKTETYILKTKQKFEDERVENLNLFLAEEEKRKKPTYLDDTSEKSSKLHEIELSDKEPLVQEQDLKKQPEKTNKFINEDHLVLEKKRKEIYHYNSIKEKPFCIFLNYGYCQKYDFGPVSCSPKNNKYKCTWRERRTSLRIGEDKNLPNDEIDKRLTLFGEFYYDPFVFNKENYYDIQDYLENVKDHINDK